MNRGEVYTNKGTEVLCGLQTWMNNNSLTKRKQETQRRRRQENKLLPNPVNVQKTITYLRLEPYEGKLSRTVLRRERRGNPPDPADV